jgi:hypothetical protein
MLAETVARGRPEKGNTMLPLGAARGAWGADGARGDLLLPSIEIIVTMLVVILPPASLQPTSHPLRPVCGRLVQ